MTPDEFEGLLRRWGRAFGERPPAEWEEEGASPVAHPLARAMAFAPGKCIKQRTTMDRGGQARRRLMAASVGIKGMRLVPGAYVDPVRCVETRRGGHVEAVDHPVPAELLRVERAALDLLNADMTRGLVLRVNYCTRGSHAEKAEAVAQKVGRVIKLKRYRDELLFAKAWMHGRLT